MPDSVRPHRRQPTRLHRPWDSPGKNTGVGCHFLLQCMKVKSESEVMSDPQRPHGLQPTRLLHPWDFPGKSTGVGCHRLLRNNTLLLSCFSRVQLFATPWTVAYQASPSMGFSRQECWSGLPFPSPGDLPDPGIEPGSPALQADALLSEPPGKPSLYPKHPSKEKNKTKQNKVKSLSRSQLLATPWTGAYQAPPSMGFSRQEYWSRVPLPLRSDVADANNRFIS